MTCGIHATLRMFSPLTKVQIHPHQERGTRHRVFHNRSDGNIQMDDDDEEEDVIEGGNHTQTEREGVETDREDGSAPSGSCSAKCTTQPESGDSQGGTASRERQGSKCVFPLCLLMQIFVTNGKM